MISPQPNSQKNVDKQGTRQEVTSLCLANARIKHGNTSSTNVTFPVPNKWSRQTRTQTRTQKHILKQSQVTSFVQFRFLQTNTHFFDQSFSETPGFSENSATGSQSACQISMFFQRMHFLRSNQLLAYHWATSISLKEKDKQLEIKTAFVHVDI